MAKHTLRCYGCKARPSSVRSRQSCRGQAGSSLAPSSKSEAGRLVDTHTPRVRQPPHLQGKAASWMIWQPAAPLSSVVQKQPNSEHINTRSLAATLGLTTERALKVALKNDMAMSSDVRRTRVEFLDIITTSNSAPVTRRRKSANVLRAGFGLRE